MLIHHCRLIIFSLLVSTCSAVAAVASEPHPKPENTTASSSQSNPDDKAPTSTDKYLVISGDFSVQKKNEDPFKVSACTKEKQCAVIVAADGTKIADANIVTIEKDQVWVTYPSKAGDAAPTFLFIGPPNDSKSRYPVDAARLPSRRLVVTGDFCQKPLSKVNDCDTNLPKTPIGSVQGYVYATDGSDAHNIVVHSIDETKADIEFTADSAFRPLWLVVKTPTKSYTFPYMQAKPDITSNVIYQAFDLPELCNPGLQCDKQIDLKPVSPSSSKVQSLGVKGTLLFARVTGPAGEEPDTLVASTATSPDPKDSKDPKIRSVLVRRVTKPASDQSLLNINMTVMDQETVRRNYGYRIAGHYIAVKLDLANRTSKKLQFNKAAIWFDADYRAVGGKHSDYFQSLATGATAGANTEDVYRNPFNPYGSKEMKKCEKRLGVKNVSTATQNAIDPKDAVNIAMCSEIMYRYGIEQSARLSPDSYLTLLAAFDYTTEHTDRVLRLIELLGSTLLPISSGSIVAQIHDTAFKDSISILTGTFLPGFRAITLDPSHVNRLRSNLVAQTMQETIQIPPNGTTYTVVLLPRDGILAIRGREQAVIVDRLVDVHIDPDVVNGIKDAPVPKDKVEYGYTKDQVRQSLGEPPSVATDAEGVTTWTYSTGAYERVVFDKTGIVITPTPRSLANQVVQKTTLNDTLNLLQSQNLTAKRLTLWNQNIILVDIPGVTQTLQFDPKGAKIADYTLLYDKIRATLVGMTTADFWKGLQALHIGDTPYGPEPKPPGEKVYPMPDIQNGRIEVTLDKDNKKVENITFTGDKPAAVK